MLALAAPAFAQSEAEELELNIRRDWGYGGLNGDIEGRFSLTADGPGDLGEVRFYLDDRVIFSDTEPPFRFQFETGQFDPGRHSISAVGLLAGGAEIRSRVIERNFLSEDEAARVTTGLVGPIIGLVVLVALVSGVLPLLTGRKKRHVPGQYGVAGGAVCPKCTLPFSRNMLGPNLLVGKLERCPHCGKWSLVPRASGQALAAAEERLAQEGEPDVAPEETEQERLARMIDASRFDE